MLLTPPDYGYEQNESIIEYVFHSDEPVVPQLTTFLHSLKLITIMWTGTKQRIDSVTVYTTVDIILYIIIYPQGSEGYSFHVTCAPTKLCDNTL